MRGGPHRVLVALRVDATSARTTRVGAASASVLAGAAASVALERFLEVLEHEPQQSSQSPQDPIKRLADFLSGDWWRFKR